MATLVFTFFASYASKKYGRSPTMRAVFFFFLVGVILNVAAMNLTMLIMGRILLHITVGFANSACDLPHHPLSYFVLVDTIIFSVQKDIDLHIFFMFKI